MLGVDGRTEYEATGHREGGRDEGQSTEKVKLPNCLLFLVQRFWSLIPDKIRLKKLWVGG